MDDVSPTTLRPPLYSSSPRDREPKEIEKLRKWQEERITRKLKGEYESAMVHLSEVINANIQNPVNVSAVRVEGAAHTRKSFLASIINPAILPQNPPSSLQPNTLEDVLHATRRISNILKKTDIFTTVEARLDRPRDSLARPGDVDLVLKTKERGRLYISSSTELGNNEGSASASARIRNVFGGAEAFEANLSLGTKTKRAFRASLTAPLTVDLATYGELSAYSMEKDLSAYTNCTEGLRGVRALARFFDQTGITVTGTHEFAYEAVIRHIAGLTPTASISTRQSAGTSVKSSFSHTFSYDTRDDKIAATRGMYGRFFQELAGLGTGGDAQFYKVEMEGQFSRKVQRTGVSVSLAAKTGFLWSLAQGGRTLFSDRFQLGGPTSVRSFKASGMGPKDGPDSVGGELYYSAGASVISDIPTKAHWPVKAHLWINVGRLDSVNQDIPLKTTVSESLSRPSISAGLGLIYKFDPVRVEVNIGLPLVASKNDGSRKGVQVGMGLEFL